ncbi:helix-turn-helix domain-containing protein [Pararhizobium sp.]|uniref:helix-turn-helix domain-containing protein n=1 Tax=Pararhizobium sp. TaxID=1977563 RepID=UPI00271DDBA3|nr:helix-turn-helix domain-containing protein [Pararhizobium sp.]MDO9416443.1 helix-turn-helix domain-containing protein [Pararhizobium sp.]
MENASDIIVGERLRLLRAGMAMTLDDLAARSGVSRAMISRIERGEASPTAQLLARLCGALGQSLSSFFATDAAASPLARREDQRLWRDPATGYLRRAVSPPGNPSPVDVVEVEFPPGAMVAFPPPPVDDGLTQHVWLMDGQLTMTVGTDVHELLPGDCLFMPLSGGHVFHNPHGKPARYAVILNRKP